MFVCCSRDQVNPKLVNNIICRLKMVEEQKACMDAKTNDNH